jgi:hypothetical protein
MCRVSAATKLTCSVSDVSVTVIFKVLNQTRDVPCIASETRVSM